MFIYIALAMLLLVMSATWYVYARLLDTLPPLPLWIRIGIGVVLFLLSISFIAAMSLRHSSMPSWITLGLFFVGTIWLILLLYMVLLLILTNLATRFFPSFQMGFVCALIGSVLILLYGNYKYHQLQVKEIDIDLPVKRPIRIAAISDVHLGEGTGRKKLAYYIDEINSRQPDLVLIAGDLVDNSIHPLIRDNMGEELSRLSAPMGIYMVPGNHEYISGIHHVDSFLQNTPIVLLRDTVLTLPVGLKIVARDDRFNKRRRTLQSLMDEAGTDMSVFLLDHQPHEVAAADSLGADIQFYGHTHRGQIWPFTWVTDAMYDQSHGYRRWEHGHVYVSQGISLWGPPFRIGSECEFVIFNIKPSE